MGPFALGPAHLATAHCLARASAAAYQEVPEQYPAFGKLRLCRVETFASADQVTRGFVGAGHSALVLAFRGTDRPQDWIANLNYAQLEGYGGRVHRGFAQALESVWEALFCLVRTLRDKKQTVWITGHSLGGALATLAAQRLEATCGPVRVYTFGQPRVGDPAFAEAFRPALFRIVNYRDIVATLPLPGPFHRYRHVGRLLWLDGKGRLHKRRVADWLPAGALAVGVAKALMARRRIGPTLEKLIQAGIEDHQIDRYVAKLRANMPAD